MEYTMGPVLVNFLRHNQMPKICSLWKHIVQMHKTYKVEALCVVTLDAEIQAARCGLR